MFSAAKTAAPSAGGYNLTRSLRFRSSASAYLNRTFAAGNQQIMTYSGWAKLGTIGSGEFTFLNGGDGTQTNLGNDAIYIQSGIFYVVFRGGAGGNPYRQFTPVYRDPSAWYHFVVAIDTTQATAANRIKLWVNGVQVTAYTGVDPAQNASFVYLNGAYGHLIGRNNETGGPQYTDGYQAEVNFIGGQALTPSSFGSTNTLTGVWQPARYAGTYGTNGFYLPFTDNSALTTSSNVGLGKDFSGNGNYWTTNNISITSGTTYDSMTDVPTLTSATAANFATLNPIDASSNGILANGNLQSTSVDIISGKGSIAVSSGKWYWEVTCIAGDYTSVGARIGIDSVLTPCKAGTSNRLGYTATSYSYNNWNGQKQNNLVSTAYGNTYTQNDVVSVALDLDNGKIWWAKNGTWQASGDPAAGTNPAYSGIATNLYTAACGDDVGGGIVLGFNFGQRPFAYTPPTGFVALNTFNLPTSTIVKGNTVMDAVLYTGNGGTNTITNAAGFKPDFAWQKSRGQAYAHGLYDSVRGVTKKLSSNSTDAENTSSGLTAFNSNGITLGSDAGENLNASSFVSWQWQAGQGTTSSNTNGTITSTVSVNASAGFSVVTYTGNSTNSTVGHGLGVKPSFIIVKVRNNAGFNWGVWHASLAGTTPFITLNTTNGASTNSVNAFISANMTSSVIGLGNEDTTNGAYNYVAYCWTPIAGYSAFGSYTGNGSTDGTFIYLGFRPKFFMIKVTNATNAWLIVDSSRSTYNVMGSYLIPNASDAEGSATVMDFVSNGVKMRNTFNGWNASGENFIYMAFAENPFKNALAR